MKMFTSDLSEQEFPESEKIYAKNIRGSLLNYIQTKNPNITPESCFSKNELSVFRENYISNYLTEQLGDLTTIEKQVVTSIAQHTSLAGKLDDEDETKAENLGDRLADKVANFGGSWKFILLFTGILIAWILFNVYILKNKGFDPYPFILLNLVLSCIAAIQAPVIMMSQNRQEDIDRLRAKKDYMINLKSELEIHSLHEKLDHIIIHQQQELLEIQKSQIEMLNSIISELKSSK